MWRWWNNLSIEWIDRLKAAGWIVLIAGGLILATVFVFPHFETAEPETAFKCGSRKWTVLELETIHKQHLVGSLVHRGIRLELRENPDADYGSFSLLWSTPEPDHDDSISCFLASGRSWTSRPDGEPYLGPPLDYDPFAQKPDGKSLK